MSNDPSTPASASAPAPVASGGRSWLPTALVIIATIVAVVSATTTWVKVQALDTDAWVEVSGELLEEPEIQVALATYLVDELYSKLDVSADLEARLPDELSGLAGTLAGALRGPAIEGVERVLQRPRLQQAWQEANRRAHEALVAIVRDETRDNVSSADGAVVLDLGGAVRTVGEDLGISSSVLDRIPEGVGQVTIIESQRLADVQDTVKLLDVMSWFLFVVVVALYVLAVYLARDRRREMLRSVGIALAVGGAALFVLRSVSVRAAVDSIVADPTNRPIGRIVGDMFTQLLSDMAITAIIIGLVIAAFAIFLGPNRWAVVGRRWLGGTERPGLIIGLGAFGVLLLLLWWSPGLVFERWVTAITVLGLIIGAAVALLVAVRSAMESAPAPEPVPTNADERPPADVST